MVWISQIMLKKYVKMQKFFKTILQKKIKFKDDNYFDFAYSKSFIEHFYIIQSRYLKKFIEY